MSPAASESDRGSALVLAVFALALLTGMGAALFCLGQHEARMSQAGLRAKKAFYLAEAGLEDGRRTLFAANGGGSFGDDLAAAAGLDDRLDFDPAALVATYNAAGEVTGFTGFGDDVPLRSLKTLATTDGPGWYMAFLTNDPLEGRHTKTDANDRVMITAVGAGPARSLEVVEAIVEPLRALPPVPPAALTLLGPLPYFDNSDSPAQSHTGNDCGVAGGPYAPIVGTVDASARAQVQSDMHRADHFSSGPQPFTGAGTVADLTDPSDPIVAAAGHGTVDAAWTDCQQLKQLVESLAAAADYYCNTDLGSCTVPSVGPGDVVFIDGDLSNGPTSSNSGTLVVTGELSYGVNAGWNGVVLVVGTGRLLRNGGGSGNPSGGVVIASIDPTPDGPRADKSDWCTTPPDGYGQAYYRVNGTGNSTVEWCTAHINEANAPQTYRVVDFLQH